jgi:hypothetical protein
MAQLIPDELQLRQASFPDFARIKDAVELLSTAGIEERGAVFTRREVVDFILDLVGYTPDRPLHHKRLLEPSTGHGEFLIASIERLIAAWQLHAPRTPVTMLASCIRAIELHRASFEETRAKVIVLLRERGLVDRDADQLVQGWLTQDDFLLTELSGTFDYVVGNPPYVRQELIPDVLIAEYRAPYRTVFDRADIYIPFIERSLSALAEGGALGFICADRWMKNRYGGPLRQMIAKRFHLKIYVDMYDTPAFHTDVIAYPAITVILRQKSGGTRVARRPSIDDSALKILAGLLLAENADPNGPVREMAGIATGDQPWIFDSTNQLELVRRLERDFPTIEDAGCKVGIGVATGADGAFIGPFQELDVEDDRKLPLVMTRDILSGVVQWRGLGVVNPFAENGRLVDLRHYPRLRHYLEAHKDQIANRHVAQRAPSNWYRTIDRIYPELTWRPKLLIPDIKGEAHIVYEAGNLYPHHNLYFITSDKWDLRALQAVLLSGIARLFIATYSTRMRGGYLRFQAQYLRRIRLPRWTDVPTSVQEELVAAAKRGDVSACNDAVFRLYGLTKAERAALGGDAD